MAENDQFSMAFYRIKIEMKRLHLDYNGDPFTIDGKAFLRNLKSQRIDSEMFMAL